MAKTVALLDPVTQGELLWEDFMAPMSLSRYRLAKEIGVAAQRIGDIVKSKRAITADTDLAVPVLRPVGRLLAPGLGCVRHRRLAARPWRGTEVDQALELDGRLTANVSDEGAGLHPLR